MSNARNSLFCRRWSVDLERYEKDNGELFWDDQDIAISNSPDGKLLNKSELIFTEYGTYIKTDYFNSLVFKRTFDNWQWNKTKGDNHIVFGGYDNNYSSSLENYVEDLTKDKMKATLSLYKIINKKHLYEPKTIVLYPSE